MDRQPTLEGERLLLRPLAPGDWDALYAVAADPLVWEIHPAHDRWQEPLFRAFFEDALARGGALVVIDKQDQRIVGSSRFQNYAAANGGSVEIGWTFLARSHWGGSANREMKRLMLGHALKSVERVYFVVGENNLRSRRAMEKIGGRLDNWSELREMSGGWVRHVRYVIDREGFANGPLSRA
jgi:RimJ/RimL family protein N-acetyltransferase